MKRLPILFSLVLLLFVQVPKVTAQYYFYDNSHYDNPVLFELGGSIALMNCLTDLGGKKGIGKKFVKDLNYGNTQLAGSIFANVMYKSAIGVRLEGTFGQIKAFDSILKNVKSTTYGRYERNLHFRSSISEASLTVEIHPLFLFINWESREGDPPRYSPYLVGGIGVFNFNPQAKIGNNWIDLQPLSTEGQGFAEYPDRKVYKLTQVNFPIGVGMKYELSSMFNLRAECVYRILKTDYLDDVSTTYIDPALFRKYFTGTKLQNALILNDRQAELDPTHVTNIGDLRGYPHNNDGYFTFNLKISLILGRQRIGK